jgi:hypothetical protein
MDQSQYVSPGEKATPPGGGPEDNGSRSVSSLGSQGLLALAFGFALGLTLVIVYFIFKLSFFPENINSLLPELARGNFLTAVYYFLFGLVPGTILAALYNVLVLRRLNLFGMEQYHN